MTDDPSLEARALEQATHPDRTRAIADGVREHVADDSSGHDLDHAWRVFLVGTQLAAETDADAAVV